MIATLHRLYCENRTCGDLRAIYFAKDSWAQFRAECDAAHGRHVHPRLLLDATVHEWEELPRGFVLFEYVDGRERLMSLKEESKA